MASTSSCERADAHKNTSLGQFVDAGTAAATLSPGFARHSRASEPGGLPRLTR